MLFVSSREMGQLRNIERTTNRKIDKMKAPTLDEALEGQQKMTIEKIVSTIESNNLAFYKRTAEELLEEHDSVSIIAAALKLMTKEPDTTPVRLTSEPPVVVKDRSKPKGKGGYGGHGGQKGREGGGNRDRSRFKGNRPANNSGSGNRRTRRVGTKQS